LAFLFLSNKTILLDSMKKKNLKTSTKNITEEAAADHHLNQVNTIKK